MQEESSRHDRLSQLVFLKYLNKTHQGIMCETKIKILYIKKHVYKKRKERTHGEIGKENINHHIYIYIKDKHNICKNSHKTSVQDAKRISYSNKEVSTPPNKMKHISPLQKNVFLPLTCRILKRNQIFSPFLS